MARVRRSTRSDVSYRPYWPPPGIEPSHRGESEHAAAERDPRFAQLYGEKAARILLEDDAFRDRADGRLAIACRHLKHEARKEVETGTGRARFLEPPYGGGAEVVRAYWRGFDWVLERAFRCACDPGRERRELDGSRRRRR